MPMSRYFVRRYIIASNFLNPHVTILPGLIGCLVHGLALFTVELNRLLLNTGPDRDQSAEVTDRTSCCDVEQRKADKLEMQKCLLYPG